MKFLFEPPVKACCQAVVMYADASSSCSAAAQTQPGGINWGPHACLQGRQEGSAGGQETQLPSWLP